MSDPNALLFVSFPRIMALEGDMLSRALETPMPQADRGELELDVPERHRDKEDQIKQLRREVQIGLMKLTSESLGMHVARAHEVNWAYLRRMTVLQKENGIEILLGDQEYKSNTGPYPKAVKLVITQDAWNAHKDDLLSIPEKLQTIFAAPKAAAQKKALLT